MNSSSSIRRFIPTDVGNSHPQLTCRYPPVVHPHGRGELIGCFVRLISLIGSSPRTWGTLHVKELRDAFCRFIPTDVGNSHTVACLLPPVVVHPHGRGELIVPSIGDTLSSGSSPRTWGTRRRTYCGAGRSWFIPTDVGNSIQVYHGLCAVLVHPHGRGELRTARDGRGGAPGSSPRTWGTHTRSHDTRHRVRFIPTDVGNSHQFSTPSNKVVVHPHGRGELSLRRLF